MLSRNGQVLITYILLSHWLGAAWEECGLHLNTTVNPEGAADGKGEITALLELNRKYFLEGDPSGHLHGCYSPSLTSHGFTYPYIFVKGSMNLSF